MPTLALPDRQVTWAPRWIFESLALPERFYATKDLPFAVTVDGAPFVIGDSEVGGDDLVGGGAGAGDRPAHGNIMGDVTVTRSLVDVLGGQIEVQQFIIDLANTDGRLRGNYRGIAVKLWRYDEASRLTVLAVTGIVSQGQRTRGAYRLLGTTLDRAILEAEIPTGVITLAEFPTADPDAIGQTPTWLFGNVTNLPLLNVRDDQIGSKFDHALCRDTAAALTGVRRVHPNVAGLDIDLTPDELEPYPGEDGVGENLGLNSWDAGATAPPNGWTLVGAGATVAKVQLGAIIGSAVTRAGTDCRLGQSIDLNGGMPLSWWRGREITVVMNVYATEGPVAGGAGRVRVRVDDGVTTFDSPVHSGVVDLITPVPEQLTVGTVALPCVISAAATRVRIEGRVESGNTIGYFENARVFLRARTWAECLRSDLYPGRTAIRTYLRQEDASGSLYQLVADVHGLQPERNPVRAIRTLLSDPTHGLGKSVDAASFDAAEIAVAMSYQDLVLPDAPTLLLDFDEASEATVALDGSGHERHGAYHPESAYPSSNADFHVGGVLGGRGVRDGAIAIYAIDAAVDDSYVDVPYYNGAYSPTADGWTFEILYHPQTDAGGGVMDTTHAYPIAEVLVGTATGTGPLRLYQEAGKIVASIGTVAAPVNPSVTLSNLHLFQWLHVVVTCSALTGGALTLAVTIVNGDDAEPTLSGTATYAGTIPTGDGTLLIGKFGTGWPGLGPGKALGYFDKAATYPRVLTAARLTARRTWLNAIINGDGPQISPTGSSNSPFTMTVLPSGFHAPTYFYTLDDIATTTMVDQGSASHHGSYVGPPTLGARGYLPNQYTGYPNQGVRFKNNVAKYAHADTVTISGTTLSISVWYKPDVQKAPSGVFEFAIGGVRDTSVSLTQTSGGAMRFQVKDAAGVLQRVTVPVLPEDVGRYMHLRLGYDNGVMMMTKNNATLATGTYASPVTVASSTLYVGCQGSTGAGLTRPCQGYIDDLAIYDTYALTDADGDWIYTAGTWQFGGLTIDAALREPRQVQDWLADLCQVRGIRLSFIDGTITCAVDAAAPTTIRLDARDGAGAGERTLIDAGPRQQTPLENAAGGLALSYRRNLLSGEYLGLFEAVIAPNRGKTLPVKLDMVREHPAAWRILDYLIKRIRYGDETVSVVLSQEARQLVAGDLVRLTDATLDYDADVLEVRKVEQSLDSVTALLAGWDASIYVPDVIAFPSGATSG